MNTGQNQVFLTQIFVLITMCLDRPELHVDDRPEKMDEKR
jgi:hypothetical protein